MYLYRATEDPTWLSIAADLVDVSWLAAGQLCCRSLVQIIEYSTRTKCAYATVENVREQSVGVSVTATDVRHCATAACLQQLQQFRHRRDPQEGL
jgi:hypothetical protein